MSSQQEFLRESALMLGLTEQGLSQRMRAPWETFEAWLMPSDAEKYRDMPEIAWQLVREIVEHERLKANAENHEAAGQFGHGKS